MRQHGIDFRSQRIVGTKSPKDGRNRVETLCCVATSPLRRARTTSAALSRLVPSVPRREPRYCYRTFGNVDSQIESSRTDIRNRELASHICNCRYYFLSAAHQAKLQTTNRFEHQFTFAKNLACQLGATLIGNGHV